MTSIDVVYFDAGGGHRSAALAVRDAMRLEQRPWPVELVNLQHVLERFDVVRRTTGFYAQDIYNWSLRRGWTQAASCALPAVHGLIRLLHPVFVRELHDFWLARRPGLVVSVIPHYNRALYESLNSALPDAALLTVMTDLADSPPHFWLERQNQDFVCGSDRAVAQALGIGIPRENVWRVSGMPVHPKFYAPAPLDRAAARTALGLDPDLPTGLVFFGGYGSAAMLQIMERLAEAPVRVQLILLCGRNAQLAAALTASKSRIARSVETFTDDVPHYMRLSDFFIGKPGPGSVSEALVMQLPVIVERNSRTMIQERYNCDWIEHQGAGLVLDNFSRVGEAVSRLLGLGVYSAFRDRIARMNNRAVFEITGIIAAMLNARVPDQPSALLSDTRARSSILEGAKRLPKDTSS